MFATVRPRNMRATAVALRSGRAVCAATSAPTPKKAPCGRPARTRAANTVPKPGATTVATLPSRKSPMKISRTALRGTRVLRAVSSGAPTTTPPA